MKTSSNMSVVVRSVDSEGEALSRLEDEIWKRREEENRKFMEKYAQIPGKKAAKATERQRHAEEARRQAEEEKRRAEEEKRA